MPPGRRPVPKARAFWPLHIAVDPRRPPPSSTKPIVYVYRHRGFPSSSATAQRYMQLRGFAEYDYSWDPSSSSTGARTTTFDVDFVKYPFGYAKFDYMMRQVPLPSARIPWMRQVPLRTCTTTSTTSCTTTSHDTSTTTSTTPEYRGCDKFLSGHVRLPLPRSRVPLPSP